MDFTAIYIISLAAVLAVLILGLSAAFRSVVARRPLLISFTSSFLVGLILLRPWQEIRLHEWPFLLLSGGLIALWVAGGTLLGAAAGLLLIKLAKLLWSEILRR